MQTITLLVAGPIKSRFNAAFTLQDFENSLRVFKLASPAGKIVISTYDGEFPPALVGLVDSVVNNPDPGYDYFRPNPWPIGNGGRGNRSNYKRLIASTLCGLQVCDEGFVIKTRVELLPRNPKVFSNWLQKCTNEFESNLSLKIGFFLEHYSGICFSINGLLGGLPDTLQLGRKADLLRVWERSNLFWASYSSVLTRKSNRFPITSEQLIGMSFLREFYSFKIEEKVRKLDRYYRSPRLVKVIIKSEREAFYFTSYKNSGFESDYLQKSFTLELSRFSIPGNVWDLVKKLSLVQAKTIYHHYRRYLVGVRRILQ